MTDTERALRREIAAQIKAKFGALAPYSLVAEFVAAPTNPE